MTLTEGGLPVGAVTEDWAEDARYFEYTAAADPIRSGHTPRVPIRSMPSAGLIVLRRMAFFLVARAYCSTTRSR